LIIYAAFFFIAGYLGAAQWDLGFPGDGRFHSPNILDPALPISKWATAGSDITSSVTLNLNFEADVLVSPNRRWVDNRLAPSPYTAARDLIMSQDRGKIV